MGIHSEKPDNAPEINNNSEAEKLYNDGSWERTADGIGPNCERKGSHPYAFYSRSWSISFPVPSGKKW